MVDKALAFGQTILGARGRLAPGPHLTRFRENLDDRHEIAHGSPIAARLVAQAVRRLADRGEPPGNVANRVGRKIVWDPEKLYAPNAPEAQPFIRRE